MVWLPYVRQPVCNAHISRPFCPFGFPLKHTIAAYAFRFYLENGIVFKRSFGAFGGSILRTCHFCLRYCIHCTVVVWAVYTLYLETIFRFFGFGLCNCMISVYTQTLSTYPQTPPLLSCVVCFAVATFALSVLREDWTAI